MDVDMRRRDEIVTTVERASIGTQRSQSHTGKHANVSRFLDFLLHGCRILYAVWRGENNVRENVIFLQMILTRIRNDGNVTKNVEKINEMGFPSLKQIEMPELVEK